MKPKNYTIFNKLEELAPLSLAESWDNSGLQLGSGEQTVNGVLVTLDVDEKAVDMAKDVGANLIISHHRYFSRCKKTLRQCRAINKTLISNDFTGLFSSYEPGFGTQGLSQFLALKLELNDLRPLGVIKSQQLIKLVVFVPESHLEKVRKAINDAGAGFIGNYRDCSFRSLGTGTFRPLEGSHPFLGSKGIIEEVAEYRLEVIVPGDVQDQVIRSMLESHPYEEVAYDLMPLNNRGQTYSFGRQGELPREMTLEALAQNIKNLLEIDHVSVCGSDRWQI